MLSALCDFVLRLAPHALRSRFYSLRYTQCALLFFAVTDTKHGHALDARHSRTIENMELLILLVYDMKN
jgi:hypothetical protein